MECCICHDPDNLIEYNHCGIYYVHQQCLETWNKNLNQCFICRQNIIDIENVHTPEPLIETTTIVISRPILRTIDNNIFCKLILCCGLPTSIGALLVLGIMLMNYK